jgi:hypothetical protein
VTLLEGVRFERRLLADLWSARIGGLLDGQRANSPSAPSHAVLLNSLPKSGTNLLLKLLNGFPGTHYVRAITPLHGSRRFVPHSQDDVLSVGVDWPRPLSADAVRRVLSRLPAGAVAAAHIPYSERAAQVVEQSDMRMVVIIRDPRDVVISSANYLATRDDHFLHEHFRVLSPEQRILASILGVSAAQSRGVGELRDIRQRLDMILRWRVESRVHVVRFEDLVGERGGGTRQTQCEAIAAIAQHVGVELEHDEIARLGEKLFGGTHTFRTGQTGTWRSAFTEVHLGAAEPLLADRLVELGYERDATWGRRSSDAGR